MLGISSTSASGNISSLFSGIDDLENKGRVQNLLALFKQFNPDLKEQLSGTSIQQYVPDELTPIDQPFAKDKLTLPRPSRDTVFYIVSPLQKIYFGAPGSGKSREVVKATNGMEVFRTTFHPDSDYMGFVGAYKPSMVDGDITYAFVPQVFAKAYVYAWQHPEQAVCLVIEEINRGNCAQIFGDLFQLLDRDKETGFSKYPLHADTDFATYLAESLSDMTAYVAKTGGNDQLLLPPNLALYATMNTSDQSLFPMDSAFKRRWEWEYVPIDYADAHTIRIKIGEYVYDWGTFIEKINPAIYELKRSEDKQLGNRFVDPLNGLLSAEQFRSKVLYYLWSDVWRDEHESSNTTIFQEQNSEGKITPIRTFGAFFEGTPDEQVVRLQQFMAANGVSPV